MFYGMRITEQAKVEYLIEAAFPLLLLVVTLGYSANTIKVPIAKFAGIKDRSASRRLSEFDPESEYGKVLM